jgi:hypothetical protein
MNKKQIIQIVIIIGAFSAAGFVLYNGLFKSSGNAAVFQSPGLAGGQSEPEDLLPNGDSLNFDILKQQNLIYNQVAYPKLDPQNDYGIPEGNLIIPPPAPSTK